jgi:hypothetical protein
MFFLIQFAAIWLAWQAGVLAAQYFPHRRPTKTVALLVSAGISVVFWLILLTVRFYIARQFAADGLLRVRFFNALDPLFFGAYFFFAYAGAMSFSAKK